MSKTKAPHLLLFSLLALPLIINPVITLSFDEVYLYPKVLWIYAVILPAALLVLWERRHYLVRSRTLTIIGLFLGWLGMTSLLSPPFSLFLWGAVDRADGFLMHSFYVLVLLTGLVWQTPRQWHSLQILLTGMVTVLALTNILQQLHWLGVPGEGAISGVSATLFGGTQGNRGYMGGTLALLLPVLIWIATQEKEVEHKWFVLFSITVVTWALAGTITRTAWAAALFGIFAIFWWRPASRRVWPFLVAGMLAFSLTVKLTENAGVAGNARTFGGQNQALTNLSGRDVLWHSALTGIQQKPLLGWGQQALWKVMAQQETNVLLKGLIAPGDSVMKRLSSDPFKPPSFIVKKSDGTKEMIVLSINKVHNEYLDYALTYGIPAALLFIVILGSAIWIGHTSMPGIAAGLVAYAVYLFFWPEIIRFAPLAWFMMGLALKDHAQTPPTIRELSKMART